MRKFSIADYLLKQILALGSGISLIVTLLICYSIRPELDFLFPAISDWGKYPQTVLVFNAGMLISALFFAGFLVITNRTKLAVLVLIGAILLITYPLPSNYKVSYQRVFHWIGAGTLFISLMWIQISYIYESLKPQFYLGILITYYVLALIGGYIFNQFSIWFEIALLFATFAIYLAWIFIKLRKYLWSKM